MSNTTSIQATIDEFNKEVNEFINDNSDRIVCMITSAVDYMYQPLVVSYQKYFNQNVITIYDSKAIYAHNHEMPNFIYTYFVLTKENKKHDSATVKEHCEIYVNNFIDFNKDVFAAISACIYDMGKFELIDEKIHGDLSNLKGLEFLNK